MAGVLFVISIPTEEEEKTIINKPRKLNFKTPSTNEREELPTTPVSRMKPMTFSKLETTPSQEPLMPQQITDLDSVSVNICESPALARTNSDRNFLRVNNKLYAALKRTKSAEQLDKTKMTPIERNVLKKSWEGIKEIVSTSKKSDKYKFDDDGLSQLGLPSDATMESVVLEIMKKMKVENAIWQLSKNGHFYQITFCTEVDGHEAVLELLNKWGIGERDGSSLSIIPCPIYQKPNIDNLPDEELAPEQQIILKQKQTAWNKFMNSVRARLNVAQIVQQVKENASITFDFVTLLIVAGMLAAIGLVENSLVVLTSSMLISPLMGPIIAITFGLVIKDIELTKLGFVNEMFGISLATTVGFVFGLIVCSIDSRFGRGEGLTEEIVSRCGFHALLIGTFIAIPSGAAVAIAILGGNIGSLVGVAISASILPPAVNAGVLWALAMLYVLYEDNEHHFKKVISTNIFSDNQALELAAYGGMSMLVTIINIICILLMGILVLKIKEVAPIVLKNQNQFWKHDIKVARDYNKTVNEEEHLFTQKLVEEIIENQPEENDLLRNINKPLYQQTWSPNSNNRTSDVRSKIDSKPTVADLQKIYRHMSIVNTLEQIPALKLPYSTSKTIGKGMSPPKYRSLITDQIFPSSMSAAYRRASMPYLSSLGVPSTSAPTFGGYKASQLEKITEISVNQNEEKKKCDSQGEISGQADGKSKKTGRKFIVTPAADP